MVYASGDMLSAGECLFGRDEEGVVVTTWTFSVMGNTEVIIWNSLVDCLA